jgi:hypothetical protein
LTIPAITRKIRGLLVSPTALKIALPKLYKRVAVMPIKYIRRYKDEGPITLSGTFINFKICGAKKTPTIVRKMPEKRAKTLEKECKILTFCK